MSFVLGTRPEYTRSRKKLPAPIEGSWSISPTSTTVSVSLIKENSFAAFSMSIIDVSSIMYNLCFFALVTSSITYPEVTTYFAIVNAAISVLSASLRVALPVGASKITP